MILRQTEASTYEISFFVMCLHEDRDTAFPKSRSETASDWVRSKGTKYSYEFVVLNRYRVSRYQKEDEG
jgi:hypothetical protein